jgi:hypothetical protein
MNALRRLSIFIFFLLASGWAVACAICAPADTQNTLVRQLVAADRIVLAQPLAASSARALVSVRGALPQETLKWDTPPTQQRVRSDDLVLLVLNAGDSGWKALGYLPASREPWLRGLTQPQGNSMVHDLEDDYPLVAQAAYDYVSAQPYAVLRALASTLDGRRVAQWVSDPSRSARRPLYYLLLGLSGKAADADAMAKEALRAEPGRNAAELSAMLAALVALRGETGLVWVEQHFLNTSGVSDVDVQAALLALSVQGTDSLVVSQSRVVAAYGRFISANPQRAGFVASDLASWGHWEFAEAFGTALRTGGAQVFASRYAMVFYLLRNPQPEAKRLVETLRAEKLL